MTDKFIFRFVAGVSVFVFLVVVILNAKVIPRPAVMPSFAVFLPKLNAILNGACTVVLIVSLFFIKRRQIQIHKNLNILAFVLSSLFLVSYILFHYLNPHEAIFGDIDGVNGLDAGEAAIVKTTRPIYLTILISHIVLAAAVLPLILLSFYRGLQMQVEKHRKLVRWTFPIWLYVTITGVVVYLLISPYYHF